MKKIFILLFLLMSMDSFASEKSKQNSLPALKPLTSKSLQPLNFGFKQTPPQLKPHANLISFAGAKLSAPPAIFKSKYVTLPISKYSLQLNIKDLNFENLKSTEFSFKNPKEQLQSTELISDDQFKLLFAQELLKSKSDLDIALSLFSSLLTNKELASQAQFEYSQTAYELKLENEAYANLIDLVSKSKNEELILKSYQFLYDHSEIIPKNDIVSFYYKSQKIKNSFSVNDTFALNIVRASLNANDLTLAFEMLELINNQSQNYSEAMILKSLLNYRIGKIEQAKNFLEKITDEDFKILKEYRDIAYLTLARIYFQLSDFKNSYNSYLKINKKSNFWLQASVEQAWTQILQEDFEGAAGNMFSLHTEFYKNIYLPDSYTARSIAYLNLCQFGDSLKVITDQSRKYSSLLSKLEPTLKIDRFEYVIYDKIKNLQTNKINKTKSLIPESILFELTTSPDFIKFQKNINSLIDENDQFTSIVRNLLNKEKDLIIEKSKFVEHHFDSNKKKKVEDITLDLNYEKQVVLYSEKISLLKNLRQSIKVMAEKYSNSNAQKLENLEKLAAQSLKSKLSIVTSELRQTIKNNESLEFEIQSRAGEHLRTQLATQELTKTENVQLQPNKEKSLHWKYSGEVWEDEIGHFRSSLKNVCPSTTAQNN